MTNEEKALDLAIFVANKFARNDVPWAYTRDLKDLRHIRYEKDYTGYNHWTKRLGRFFRRITVDYWEPKGLWKDLDGEKKFWAKFKDWPLHIASWWRVSVQKDNNLPDGQVNGIITHWEEDGEYISLFSPYTGQAVLDFIKEDPDNPHAKEILKRMTMAYELMLIHEEHDEKD